MHQYLRAIGFSSIENNKRLKEILNLTVAAPNDKKYLEREDGHYIVEYSKNFTPSTGITLRGEYDDNNELTLDFYFPYLLGNHISTTENISIERHAMQESYAGVCEDTRVGVSLIFFLQNGLEYMRENRNDDLGSVDAPLVLTGLSNYGLIVLPIKKDEKEKAMIKKANSDRSERIIAARKGDEEALEKLTLEDIDTYTTVSRKILKEDVLSLVDSYFMPTGVECDQYSIMGEIEDYTTEVNSITGEEIYIITINYNTMYINVCVNKKDILGEPAKGRRFKGNILLQGKVDFNR